MSLGAVDGVDDIMEGQIEGNQIRGELLDKIPSLFLLPARCANLDNGKSTIDNNQCYPFHDNDDDYGDDNDRKYIFK